MKINALWASILTLGFRLMKTFVDMINIPTYKNMVEGLRLSMIDTVEVLSDADPNDEEQLRAVANKLFAEGNPFRKGSRDLLVMNIAKIPIENARDVLSNLVDPVYETANILTDENIDDGGQIIDMLQAFLTSEKGLETYVSLLDFILPRDQAVAVGAIILSYLEQIWDERPEEAVAAGLPDKSKIVALRDRQLGKVA